MKRKNQEAICEIQRKKRAAEQIQNQELQLKQWIKSIVISNQGMEYLDQASFRDTYKIMMHKGKSFLCAVDILEDPNLTSNAKVLFQIISSLSYVEGYCYASNGYLAKKMGVSAERIKAYVTELDNYGLIKRDTYNTILGKRRNIHIQFQFIKDLYFKKEKKRY